MDVPRQRRIVRGAHGMWELHVRDADDGGLLVSLLRPHRPDSGAAYIQAINRDVPEERLLWTTTDDAIRYVLDEIEAGLVAGRIVQPVQAVFSGAQPPWARFDTGGLVFADVPVATLDLARCAAMDAYVLVDQLPNGRERVAAWNAYVFQTYGDNLLRAGRDGQVALDTADMARHLFARAVAWLERATWSGHEKDDELPDWLTATRSQEQLVGMRETLETLRTHIEAELSRRDEGAETGRNRLAGIESRLEQAALLWVARPPAELRRGVGLTLTLGLDEAYKLGQAVLRS